MACYYKKYHIENTISWISPIVNPSDSALRAMAEQEGWGRFCHVVYPLGFALRATTQHVGKAGELQILCCQGIKVTDYNFTLDVLALKPSDFCNVGLTVPEVFNGRYSGLTRIQSKRKQS